jgi:hypothetical protein
MRPSKKRAFVRSQSLKHKKNNPKVPAALGVFLYLPGVGSVLDYEWFEQPVTPVRLPEPVAPVVSHRPCLDPRELDRLCSNPAALRKFLAEKQRQIDAFEPWRKKPAFAEISGALSSGVR